MRGCAARWNREATPKQRAHVGLAAVISPLRRDMPAGAWVGGWPLAPARAQEAGGAGATVVLRRDECLVVTGTDTGFAYVRVPRRGWVRVSADTPYDPPWFLSSLAAKGGIAFVRRDGTVVPAGGP